MRASLFRNRNKFLHQNFGEKIMVTIFTIFLLVTSAITVLSKQNRNRHKTMSVTHSQKVEGRKDCIKYNMKKGDGCIAKWEKVKHLMHPTQDNVGFTWIFYKIQKDFTNKEDAQEELDDKPIPVCIGIDHEFYIIDHHHLLSALDFTDFTSLNVKIDIVCDFSDAKDTEEFWGYMYEQKNVLPYGRNDVEPNKLPIPIETSEFPRIVNFNSTGSYFKDNYWRSLSGLSRKIQDPSCKSNGLDKYCMRAFNKVCDDDNNGIPFFEFRWDFFFNYAYNYDSNLWPSSAESHNFDIKLKSAIRSGKHDIEKWMDASIALLPLARSENAGSFVIPESYEIMSGSLPGWVSGMEGIDKKDPDCNPPSCKKKKKKIIKN